MFSNFVPREHRRAASELFPKNMHPKSVALLELPILDERLFIMPFVKSNLLDLSDAMQVALRKKVQGEL